MKTVGIIAEFNPFHNGHEYIIKEAKKRSGADQAVVVMSGSFVQRGEPALFDKWTRTQAALLNGADLVLELPALFSSGSAETFASAAVRILNDSNIVDTLCFGSESGDLVAMMEASKLLSNESEEFQRLLRIHLDDGLSYPAARAKALEIVSHVSKEILAQPNNILGIEYLKAMERYSSHMTPMTIQRVGAGFHNDSISAEYASAAAIRKAVLANNIGEALSQVPKNARDVYAKELSLGTGPVTWSGLEDALHYKMRTMSAEELNNICEVTEGLENRILRSIDTLYNIEEIIQYIKTKRYTRTKIQRILTHILLDIKESEVSYFMKKSKMPYIRVLGFSKERADILADLTERSASPVLTNLKKASTQLSEDGLHLLALEKFATDLHSMAAPNPIYRAPNKDFTAPLVIL